MSRLDTVRDRTAKVKKRMLPRQTPARGAAGGYADRLGPRMEAAREVVIPRMETVREKVRDDVLPKVTEAAAAALAASEPVRDEAKLRGIATLAALKGEVKPRDVKKTRKPKRGGTLRRVVLLLGLAVAGTAAWKWWKRQNELDWNNVDEFRSPSSPTLVGTESREPTDMWPPSTGESTAERGAASPDEALADAAEAETREHERRP